MIENTPLRKCFSRQNLQGGNTFFAFRKGQKSIMRNKFNCSKLLLLKKKIMFSWLKRKKLFKIADYLTFLRFSPC